MTIGKLITRAWALVAHLFVASFGNGMRHGPCMEKIELVYNSRVSMVSMRSPERMNMMLMEVETMVTEVLVLETQSTLRGMMSRRVTRSDETPRLLVDDDSTSW